MTGPLPRLARPLYLLFTALAYLLGASLAHYLGVRWQPARFFWGLVCALALQLSATVLCAYFRPPAEPLTAGETPRQRAETRARLLQTAIVTLTGATLAALGLIYAGLPPAAGLMLTLIAILTLAWAMPPARLIYSGYGELTLAVVWANLLPAFAFLLQNGALHRLLPLITFPLTFLALALLLVENFATFAADETYGRLTLLRRITWPRAVLLHHLFLGVAALLFLTAPAFGLPWGTLWPLLLILPFALAQGWRLQQIASGGRTLWKLSLALAYATFGLTLYFLALTFWLR